MAKATEAKEVVKDKAYYEELVTVHLFKDDGRYSDDVFVAVNGVGMIVPRGKDVQIPRKYAIALENSKKQDEFAASSNREMAKRGQSSELN